MCIIRAPKVQTPEMPAGAPPPAAEGAEDIRLGAGGTPPREQQGGRRRLQLGRGSSQS